MPDKMMIRETTPDDTAQILDLCGEVFPDEELRPLVKALLGVGPQVLSLAGFEGETIVAHVLLTRCGTQEHDQSGALLGPLGVAPARQRQGLGDALVRAGLEILEDQGVRQVCVLGDPAYYSRFGFAREDKVTGPYPNPVQWADAWESLTLAGRAPLAGGQLLLPEPWMNAGLWGE